MGACSFHLSGYDEGSEFYNSKMVKARREHRCCECNKIIEKAEVHETVVGKWEGLIQRYRTCALCMEIRTKFGERGWLFGSVWDDIHEYLFPEMNFNCMEGLSPEARTRIIERWQKWKGL